MHKGKIIETVHKSKTTESVHKSKTTETVHKSNRKIKLSLCHVFEEKHEEWYLDKREQIDTLLLISKKTF